jgi:hypothetical protein
MHQLLARQGRLTILEDYRLIAPETKGRSIEEFEKALKRTARGL